MRQSLVQAHLEVRAVAQSSSLVRWRCLAACVALAAVSVVQPGRIAAQEATAATGRVTGRVIDARSGVGLTDVALRVVGSNLGTMSGVDGRFTLASIPAGVVSIEARRLGYTAKTVTNINLTAGTAVEQHIALTSATVQLEAVSVTAALERGSVNEALDRQRAATGIVNAVTSEQIARSPDADAAQAVQRVSGVTVQDGRYVFVRGLGERYTTTSLNGARLPSPEPERKVVPLDLFPSGLLQTVTATKTFTPDLPGDFSGAQVDITTREFPATRQLSVSSTFGYNARAFGSLPLAAGVGGEQFAFAASSRGLPAVVRNAGDLTGTSQATKNEIIRSFRDVWQPSKGGGRPNGSLSASVGGNDALFGQRIGYLLSGTYSYAQEVRAGQVRSLARVGGAGDSEVEYNRFDGLTSRASALEGGLLNLSTMLGTATRLTFNNTYNRTSDNDARTEQGTYEDLSIPVNIQRLDYVERSIWSSQLASEHELGANHLDLAITASGVTRDQPDRSEFVQEIVRGASGATDRALWLNSTSEGAVRTFAALDEHSVEGRANYTRRFGSPAHALQLKFGGLARSTSRDADTRSYGISARALSEQQRAMTPDQLFDGALTAGDADILSVRSLAQGGSYSASDRLAAGYAMTELPIGSRLSLITGARVEKSDVEVDATNTLGEPSVAKRSFSDVLPAATLNIKASERMNVRLSASRTLARPEYRELAAIRTRDVIGGVDVRGNPDLIRTRIDNLDLRWEFYPDAGEIFSVGVFAKKFHDPIERVFRASNTNSLVTFVNADGASNVGVELELRKGLGFLSPSLAPLAVFSNVTAMRSSIQIAARDASTTRAERAMVGQAPYVVNAGLTYSRPGSEGSATLLFNRVGSRITEAGELPLPDVVEVARDVLDFSVRLPVSGRTSIRFDARNLFDAPYRLEQGSVVREAYRAGRVFQTGVVWRP
ncbi:MAG: TonB-dependent receptor [Gemmatimonadaceae bacterium]